MKKINIYFDYAQSRTSSITGNGEPMSSEEIQDIKWRAQRFQNELALHIPDGYTLEVLLMSIGDRVAHYQVCSSLGSDDLKSRIAEVAKGLGLAPPDLRPG